MVTLFVYGTLQHGPLLERLLGRVPASAPARLPGHRAAPLAGRAYPGLLVDEAAVAHGRIIEVSTTEAEVLDRFEGSEYERVDVAVIADDDATVQCGAWLLTGASSRLAEAGEWDLTRFLAEDVDRFVGGSVAGRAHPGAGS